MTKSDQTDEWTPEKPRAIARRRQVLDAAAVCFRRYGFHASSMAQIADQAGMSVGHIYRYFVGKEAIIAAIVRTDVDDILAKMADFPLDVPDVKAALIARSAEAAMMASKAPEAALMIEIRAEAARNPKVRAAVKQGDDQLAAKLREFIAVAVGRPITPQDLEARAEMFHLIVQGMALRAVVNADNDRTDLSRLVAVVLAAILA